jgi:hypothetical protein
MSEANQSFEKWSRNYDKLEKANGAAWTVNFENNKLGEPDAFVPPTDEKYYDYRERLENFVPVCRCCECVHGRLHEEDDIDYWSGAHDGYECWWTCDLNMPICDILMEFDRFAGCTCGCSNPRKFEKHGLPPCEQPKGSTAPGYCNCPYEC